VTSQLGSGGGEVRELAARLATATTSDDVLDGVTAFVACNRSDGEAFSMFCPRPEVLVQDCVRVLRTERHSEAELKQALFTGLSLTDREFGTMPKLLALARKTFTLESVFGSEFVTRSASYNDVWAPHGLEQQVLALLDGPIGATGFLCWTRRKGMRPFDAPQVHAFENVRRMVRKTLTRCTKTYAAALVAALADSLDVLGVVFDGHGMPLWMSRGAVRRAGDLYGMFHGRPLFWRWSSEFERWRDGATAALRKAEPAPLRDARYLFRVYEGEPGPLVVVTEGERPQNPAEIASTAPEAQARALAILAAPPLAPPVGRGAGLEERCWRARHLWSLTAKQTTVLLHVVQGLSNKEIAGLIGCAERTVEVHVSALLKKMRAESRGRLVATFWLGST
jgi:DNA-binding CsgD family transcriptional regulator